jgi:predicted DNA-binding transcriptional regulator AlpA
MAKKFTITQAAKKLGISRAAIYRAIKEKRLAAKQGVFITSRVVKTRQRGWQISEKALTNYKISDFHVYAGKKN